MVAIRVEEHLPRAALDFLRHCYKFTNEEWQHADRLDLPDQGYESLFRTSCISRFNEWEISEQREMRLGHDASTASGVLHETDIVAKHPDCNAIMELKNRTEPPAKNDVIILFAKILDYLAINPALLLKEICPIFMSTFAFDVNGLAGCLGLGIHPICPGLRPIPLLVDNARRIEYELQQGLQLSEETNDRFGDFCANVNNLCLGLSETWIGSRFGYRSEDTIVVKAPPTSESQAMGNVLRQLNTECNWLLARAREAMK